MAWKLRDKANKLLADEINLCPPAAGGDLRFAMCYPNRYFVGMSNLGFQTLYGLLNNEPGVVCERAFLPDNDDLDELRRSPTRGALCTLESQRPLQDYDIIGFSMSYELDFPNLLKILDLAAIPLRSSQRDERWPLLVAGGAISFLNPEPIADFFDVFVVGEGEDAVRQIVALYREYRGRPRADLLDALAGLEGVYVPALYDFTYEGPYITSRVAHGSAAAKVKRLAVPSLDFASHTSVITPHTEFSRSFLVEVSRGCPYLCRFCVVGYVYTPNRWRDVELLWETCQRGLQHTDRIGMLGAVVNLYPKMPELTRRLLAVGAKCSFASLRADSLSDAVVDAIEASGQGTLTLAPETGDADLRWFINKKMKDEALFRALDKGVTRGVRNFRLYFMMGIPGETEANVTETIRIIADAHRVIRDKARPGATLSVSMSQFIPKAGTPFQWMPQADSDDVEANMRRVRAAFKGAPGLELKMESSRWCKIQGLLARADRRMSHVLERVYWSTSASDYQRACEAVGLDMDSLLYSHRDPSRIMPWDVVQTDDLRETMIVELDKAHDMLRKRRSPELASA